MLSVFKIRVNSRNSRKKIRVYLCLSVVKNSNLSYSLRSFSSFVSLFPLASHQRRLAVNNFFPFVSFCKNFLLCAFASLRETLPKCHKVVIMKTQWLCYNRLSRGGGTRQSAIRPL